MAGEAKAIASTATKIAPYSGPIAAMFAVQSVLNMINAKKKYKQTESFPRANAAFQPVSAKAGALPSMWSPQQFADMAKKDQGAALEAARRAGVTEFKDGQAYGTNKYSGLPIKMHGLTSDIFGLDKSGSVSSSGTTGTPGTAALAGAAQAATGSYGASGASGGVPSTIPAPPALSSPLVRNAAGKATGYKTEIQVLPQVQDFSVQDAGNRERKRRARLRAENTTIATSGRGLVGTANTGTKTLFGQ